MRIPETQKYDLHYHVCPKCKTIEPCTLQDDIELISLMCNMCTEREIEMSVIEANLRNWTYVETTYKGLQSDFTAMIQVSRCPF